MGNDILFENNSFSAYKQENYKQPDRYETQFFIDRFFFRLWMIPNTTLIIHQVSENEYSFSGQSEKQNTFFFQSGNC